MKPLKILMVGDSALAQHLEKDPHFGSSLNRRGHSLKRLVPFMGISGTNEKDQHLPVGYFLDEADVIILEHSLHGWGPHPDFTGEDWLSEWKKNGYDLKGKTVGASPPDHQPYLERHLTVDHFAEAICAAIQEAAPA